ncbi:hypothetical protein ACWCOT_04370 [Nonomuraea bangladeshensis]
MAKESGPGAAVHLPFEELGLGVDAFGTAVAERQAERGVHRGEIIGRPLGEGVHVRQIDLSCELCPGAQQPIVAALRVEEGGEVPDEATQHGHLTAGGEGGIGRFPLGVAEPGQRLPERLPLASDRCAPEPPKP